MDKFTKDDFFAKDVIRDARGVEKVVEILNTLTDEQKKAVETYAKSRYDDGMYAGRLGL